MLQKIITKTSISIIDPETKSVVSVGCDNKQVTRENSTLTDKDKQYGSYTTMFLKNLLAQHLPKRMSYADRIKFISKEIDKAGLLNCPTLRNFSSRLRKTFDNEKFYPKGTYFYEKCK